MTEKTVPMPQLKSRRFTTQGLSPLPPPFKVPPGLGLTPPVLAPVKPEPVKENPVPVAPAPPPVVIEPTPTPAPTPPPEKKKPVLPPMPKPDLKSGQKKADPRGVREISHANRDPKTGSRGVSTNPSRISIRRTIPLCTNGALSNAASVN